ncbi:MAG TPA: glycosyltransferase family 2 protein [Parafilimonas sp.]|nr:glycosyltransferase family 2 protein [Parafilimonas sp.]
MINRLSPKFNKKIVKNHYPTVSFIVAAYNEQEIIEEKIKNSLKQVYPSSKIEFIFITDGSSDGTASIISFYPQIKLMHLPERKGKSAALNRAVAASRNDILIISDANTFLNTEAVNLIVSHYQDGIIGGVAGEKRIIKLSDEIDSVGSREGLYWRYESFLKKIDSEFYSVVGAAGELFSVRRDLYESIPESTILDDFVISLKTAQKGYRIIYEPRAYATELPSMSLKDEKKRKIRIAAGGFQAIQMLSSLFKFWKHPRLSFLYISHRVLRWLVSPFCLILVLVSNIIIVLKGNSSFYTFCLFLQIAFYLISFISSYISSDSRVKFFKFAGYFVFMNVSVIQGFFRFIFNKQQATWEKADRQTMKINID